MKKFYSIILSILLIFISLQSVNAKEELKLHSEYAYLYDPQTSMIYIDQKSNERIYPASMTKILTVAVALEKIDDISKKVTITHEDLAGLREANASVAGFYEGEVVTYEDLLYGALLPSGADACNALGRLLFENKQGMVEAMNQKVKELNLKETHFVNVTGLHDDHHYTTPREMAKILEDALHIKGFKDIFEARKYTSSSSRLTWSSSLQRGHQTIGADVSKIDGGKSGFTDEAQLTFASTMTIDGHQLILVTAKANGQYTQNHVKDIITVYQYMNEHYQNYIVYKKDDELYVYYTLNTFDISKTYQAQETVSFLIDKSYKDDDIQKVITKEPLLFAPVKTGQQIGQIDVLYKDNVLYQRPLFAYTTIEREIPAMMIMYGLPVCLIVSGVIVLFRKRKNS